LNVRGIARTPLAKSTKSTHDVGWSQFLDILSQEAEEAGAQSIAVDPKNTTQECSPCGALPEDNKALSVRMHDCLFCGYVVGWDVNAARNILGLGRSLQAPTYPGTESVA